MMQKFTKTELAWIYDALSKEVNRKIAEMNQCEVGSPAYHLAELRKDNLRSMMHKINIALGENHKRIAIE